MSPPYYKPLFIKDFISPEVYKINTSWIIKSLREKKTVIMLLLILLCHYTTHVDSFCLSLNPHTIKGLFVTPSHIQINLQFVSFKQSSSILAWYMRSISLIPLMTVHFQILELRILIFYGLFIFFIVFRWF